MPVVAERLTEDEPIILFTYEGALDQAVFQEVLALNAKYIEEVGGPIYILADIRKLETTFGEMVRIMKQAQEGNEGGGAGSVFDDNIKMLVFVGNSAFIEMYRTTMQNRGAVFGMPVFGDMETALQAIRIDLGRQTGEHKTI